MTDEFDEPALAAPTIGPQGTNKISSHVQGEIRALMVEQPYAVLCTQGGGQPYGSVVAFAVNEPLTRAVFATPRTTRKYRLLNECSRVALVVDDRTRSPVELSTIHAVTATGTAVELERDDAYADWQRLLFAKHPHMREFIRAPSSALFLINILRYFHVTRLQEVFQWTPPTS